MDSSGLWTEYAVLLFNILVLNSTSCHDSSSANTVNVSRGRQPADMVSGQHMPSSWYYASIDALPEHSTSSSHPQSRWRTQMAFSKTVNSFEVKEDTAPGTVVGKVDTASRSLTPITFSVQEDDGENLFLLSPLSGEFLLSRRLDFETQRYYILTVALQQGDSRISSVRVYFNVLDVNDNPPLFSQEAFSASLLEGTPVGTCFMTLNVSDKDYGENGDLKLRVIGGDEKGAFLINSAGSICLKTELDREIKSIYNLTVMANDCAQPVSFQLTSSAHVIVEVQDINDKAPVFVSPQIFFIPENTALHSVVMTVQAEDEDTGSNGEVLYYLSNTSGGLFSIDGRSGQIYLEKELDREKVDTLTITVMAADRGSPRMETSLNLTVHIEDVNDNDPEFSQSIYSLTVREDIRRGTSLLKVHATDRDTGKNGQVRYKLTHGSPFVVDSVQGVITVMDQLDREIQSNYELIITAIDQGIVPRSAAAAFTVIVLDVNDFTPIFTPETLTIHVMENEEDPIQLTHQVTAVDEDLGINSQLTYFIQTGHDDGLFSVSTNGTFQIRQSLDREKEPLYHVTIIAVDSGLPPLTGTLTVHVTVDDMNDNQPEFTEEIYNTIVSEDSPTGTVFAMITASDIDEGLSGEVRYSLENLDVPFAIDETSGELLTTSVLDRETVAIYSLVVIGSDKHPSKPLSSSVLITVLIIDVNDHWPQFMNSPYVAYVPTEMTPGSVVCAVRASDGDSDMNAELHYSLYGPSSDLFSIHPYSGTVFTSSSLQRTEDITINVHVEDAGENPKFDISTISIRFQNISEFPQMKVDVVSNSLSEDEPVGTLIAVISAVSTRAEPVSFYLASGNFEDMFHVDQLTGVLTVENPLDYESKREFTLLIEARDSGAAPFSSFEELNISITDVNDNSPHFTQAEYRCEVFESLPPSWVCDVLAIDADSGIYGAVQYNITGGNDDNFFTIDPETGLLSTTMSLDRETVAEFNLKVEASEINNPFHKHNATVIVAVLDRNDNAPHFSRIFLTTVPEDSPVGQTVLQVTATDDDNGPNAVINYSIINQSEDTPFDIDFINGFIMVIRPLDRETQDHYILRVNANDSAWSISTDVTVVIADVNDNSPVFMDLFYTVVLPETTDKEVFVMQVLALDADLGPNSEILYVIEPPNEDFWVNATTGEIYTKQPLKIKDSALEIYQSKVFAFDCGSPPLHSNTTITVRLEPYNHHPPMFLHPKPLIAVPYHLAVGTEIVQFAAIDQDVNNNSDGIEFVLKGGNASDFFWIQHDSGKLILNQSLASKMNSFLTLGVLAKDHGYPPLSSRTEITIEITGRNHFSPSFKEPEVTFSIPEDLSVGSVVGKIHAEDKDYGSNGAIMYHIIPGNLHLPLALGETSGLLILIRELDFETEGIYHLQVQAMDGGWISKTGMLNVTVVVMDVNDNPPVFSSFEYIVSVPENAEIGTKVLDVKATDADSGINAQMVYSLIAGHINKFAIDVRNGTITTLVVFDYEQEQSFDVTVKTANIGGRTLFSLVHVVIYITDVNEFKPMLDKKDFNFSVFKSAAVGTVIGKVTAKDNDRGPQGQVFFLMFGQNKYLGFEIHEQTGEIYTTRSLRKQGNSVVDSRVLAKNPGVITGTDEDEATVHITVIDTNVAPVFTSMLHMANVSEDSAVGMSVLTLSALDDDSFLDWNKFFFTIESGNTNFSFTVDPSSGIISVNSLLDRELWPYYNLTLTVTDNGSPPATGTTYVVVAIEDVNDNAPKLTFTETHVKENQPQGTVVARLNASDADLPPNQGPFTYWLVNPSTDAFSLTPDGVLATEGTIDREQISLYQLMVKVQDRGLPQQSYTSIFHIHITDENDNPPMPRNIFIEVKYFGSSFQGGTIGNVHPEDPDESDSFNCAIKSGSHNMFTIPNGTCELWSSPFQGEATFNITVEASDQLHFPVNNSIYVNYKGFTNASIDSCILFYVSSSSIEEFLSSNYLRFVKALDSLFNLQASKTHVFGIKQIGGEILLLAAIKNYNGRFLSKEVASGISAGHKRLLEVQSNVTISHITSDPCLNSLCQNGATCNKNIHISQEVAVLESEAVIFVSPQKEVFNCTCPAGFMGTLCEDDVNECKGNPCKNGGTCVNTPGSFYCHCQSGFSGSVCSADGEECLRVKCQNGGTCIASQDGYQCQCVPGFEGETCEQLIDHCRSTPCVHGNCTNSQSGFSCHCPFGVSGIYCEGHSYGFEELSFMEFPPLDRRINLISLDFATVHRDSLLLYNPGGSSSREFFALEILDGSVHLSYDLGSGPVRLQTNKEVADGYFHSVTVRRIGNIGSLHVDNCTDVDNGEFCFSQSDGSGNLERTLDVGSNMTFGGLRSIESVLMYPAQIKTHDFVGCVRNIYVNGILLRPSMAFAAYNILDRCPRASPPPCYNRPCKNGGICHDLWSDYLCECKSSFTGNNCTKETSEDLVMQFNGTDYIKYMIREKFKRDYLLKNLLDDEKDGNTESQIMFSTKFKTHNDGVLVHFIHQTGHIILKIKDRRPVFVSKHTLSGRLSEFSVDSSVAEGAWHVLSLFTEGQDIFLLLDSRPVLNITGHGVHLSPYTVEKIVLGKAHTDNSAHQQSGFIGCVQYFNMSGRPLPVTGHSVMVDVWPSLSLLQTSCSAPDVCVPSSCSDIDSARRGCLSADCQSGWRCSSAVQNNSCICFHNVSNHYCDVCVSTAESRDGCSEARSSGPLWLIAVILPLISIMVIIGMIAFLYRARQEKAKCQRIGTQQKTERGADNMAFCFDDNRTLTDAAAMGQEGNHNPVRAEQQSSCEEFYCEASLPSAQAAAHSEPEYYEIGSISSVIHSESDSLKLSFHNSAKCVKAEPKHWGNIKMFSAGIWSSEERSKSAEKHQNIPSVANSQDSPSCDIKSFPQTEFPAPVQCLTFEEISKLNNPLERRIKHEALLRSSPMMEVLSDSDTDSSFTAAEFDHGHFSLISDKKFTHEQSSLKKHRTLTPNSPSKPDSPSAQTSTERGLCTVFEQWDNIFSMQLPFSSYASVFEDIACLPIEPSQSYDMQSDIEEII